MNASVAAEFQRTFDKLGTRVNAFSVGAISVEEGASVTSKIKNLSDSINLLQSNILVLKAEDKERRMLDNHPFSSLYAITKDVNKKIEKNKLHESVLKTAIRSVALNQIAEDTVEVNTDPSIANNDDNPKLKILELVMKQRDVFQELQETGKLLNTKYIQEIENKRALVKELDHLNNILKAHKEELDAKAKEESNNEVMKHLHARLEKLNITRMLIVRLLGVGKINFQEYPEWVKLFSYCRKPITLASLQIAQQQS